MSYENPQQPEGINVSDDSPVRELFLLLGGVVVGVVLLVFLLSALAAWFAQYIPFATEQQIAKVIGVEELFTGQSDSADDEKAKQHKALLEALTPTLVQLADPDRTVTITVHYSDDATVNAFATLGGHVVMHRGLIERLPNENALAMVLAHEIAHVKLRHPIVATSRGLTVSLALGSIFGLSDNSFVGQIVEWIGYSSTLSYSREQEREADELAAEMLIAHYGHLEGAQALFEALADASSDGVAGLNSLDFLSTHPDLAERMQTLDERNRALGHSGQVTPLPWKLPDE